MIPGSRISHFGFGTKILFPVFQSQAVATQSTNVSSHPLTMPSGIVAGETLICFGFFFKTFGSAFTTTLSGWTQISTVNGVIGGIAPYRATVWYKKAAGGDTGTVSTSDIVQSICRVYRISNAADPAITPPEASSYATGSTGSPDSPLLTPTGGTDNYLWLTGSGVQSASIPTVAPTNYSNLNAASNGGSIGDGVAERALNASSENPGAFTSPATNWVAVTVAIYPR